MGLLKQGVAATRIFAITAGIGLTINIKLSKNGAVLANPAAGSSNLTEIGGGLYKFGLGTGDVDTLGKLAYALTDAATNLVVYTNPDCCDDVFVALPGEAVVLPTGTGAGQIQLTNGGVTLADGVAHGGTPGSSTATLALARANVTNGSGGGDAVVFEANNGNAMRLQAAGDDHHGFVAYGSSGGGVNDGMRLVAGTGGVDLRADGLEVAGPKINANFSASSSHIENLFPVVVIRADSGFLGQVFGANLYDSSGFPTVSELENSELAVRILETVGFSSLADRLFQDQACTVPLASMTNQGMFPTAGGWRSLNPGEFPGNFFAFYKNSATDSLEYVAISTAAVVSGNFVAYDKIASIVDVTRPVTLASGERDAIANALLNLADGIEAGIPLKQAIQAILAVTTGDMRTLANIWMAKNPSGDKTRVISSTTDASGQRLGNPTFDFS